MRINTNRWNKIRYTMYTPVYDWVARYFAVSRKKSIDLLNIKPNQRVLIIGAGTGLDLEFLPVGCHIVATDITSSMVEKTKDRNVLLKHDLESVVMDGQALALSNNSFDFVLLHLILAVIPNPEACIQEAERVLRSGGKVAVFDKFVRKNMNVSFFRRCLNVFTNIFFSDITRDFESIVKCTDLIVLSDESADFNGNFRLIQLMKR